MGKSGSSVARGPSRSPGHLPDMRGVDREKKGKRKRLDPSTLLVRTRLVATKEARRESGSQKATPSPRSARVTDTPNISLSFPPVRSFQTPRSGSSLPALAMARWKKYKKRVGERRRPLRILFLNQVGWGGSHSTAQLRVATALYHFHSRGLYQPTKRMRAVASGDRRVKGWTRHVPDGDRAAQRCFPILERWAIRAGPRRLRALVGVEIGILEVEVEWRR